MVSLDDNNTGSIDRCTIELRPGRNTTIPSWKVYGILCIPKRFRFVFPGYKIPFVFQTDIGDLSVAVSSASWSTPVGDSNAGQYVIGMGDYWKKHPELQPGSELRITRESELVYLLEI